MLKGCEMIWRASAVAQNVSFRITGDSAMVGFVLQQCHQLAVESGFANIQLFNMNLRTVTLGALVD